MLEKEIATDSAVIPQNSVPRWMYAPFRKLRPPIVVIGMHRSGTSLVAAILALMGVYMGRIGDSEEESKLIIHHTPRNSLIIYSSQKSNGFVPTPKRVRDGYGEDGSFRLVNERIFTRAGATWDNVDPLLALQDNPQFTKSAVRILQRATFGILRTQYLGSMPNGYEGPWGWKDPRNTFALRYWLQLFPNAKVLHVRRSPDAVVRSLMRRAESWAVETPHFSPPLHRRVVRALTNPRLAFERFVLRRQFQQPHPKTEEDWRRLYDQYVSEGEKYRALGDRYSEVSYEDLLQNPQEIITAIANFTEIEINEVILRQATGLIIPPETKRW
jgi:hypothetical protein